MDDVTNLSATLGILSAMITPIVLLSACASLTISTSNRLGRSMDRTRRLLERLAQVTGADAQSLDVDEADLLMEQLHMSANRARILHRALTGLYASISLFIATSVILGMVALTSERYAWFPLVLALVGAGMLLYAAVQLITETRIAKRAISGEMDFALRRSRQFGMKVHPPETAMP